MWFALQIIIQLLRNHYLVGHFDWDRWKFASMIVAMQHSGAARWLNESRYMLLLIFFWVVKSIDDQYKTLFLPTPAYHQPFFLFFFFKCPF